ncbi:MAG: hypothetical protein IKC33_04610, partial [Clostridia bacterium]|nr:hypothetical protein [Clostridia bacterium]
DEALPVAAITPASELVAIVKPKLARNLILETIILFVCAVLSVGADAFMFSTSIFTDIFGPLGDSRTIIIATVSLIVHLAPIIFWVIQLYKKFVRFDNYSVIVTSDKIITCGKGSYTEINSLLVTDLTDVKVGKNYATLVAQKTKIKIYLKNPEAFRDLIQSVYDNAQ